MAELPGFSLQDFAAYEEGRQRDPECNAYRLAVRRKLDAYGKDLVAHLRKDSGLHLSCRTSLNHPHRYNRGRVRAQVVYLSRPPGEKKELVARVGPALGQDVDTHYIQATLVLGIDQDGLEQALRIHALAWWDGLNLKCKTEQAPELEAWLELLNSLPEGFLLLMDHWRKEYLPGRLTRQDLDAYFSSYQPGEHWLHLRRRLSPGEVVELGSGLADYARAGARALAPCYRFLRWSPENDHLFDRDGRLRRPAAR